MFFNLPHLQTKLLKEPDKEREPQLQEGHDVVRLKLLVLFGQHACDTYQFWISDWVPISCNHAAYDVGDEHIEFPIQALKKLVSWHSHTAQGKYRVLVLIGLGIQLRTGKNMSNQNKNMIFVSVSITTLWG